MTKKSWITKDELTVAYKKALKIFNDFCKGDDEQQWTEIEINNKYFDIDCYQEVDEAFCSIYPTYCTKGGQWRETDFNRYIRLFTRKLGGK